MHGVSTPRRPISSTTDRRTDPVKVRRRPVESTTMEKIAAAVGALLAGRRMAAPQAGLARLGVALVAVSLADVVTTVVALSWGLQEMSLGGTVALATAGAAGLVVLKLGAMALVWALSRGWPAVGRSVGWGLTAITAVAVAWNVYAIGTTPGIA
jgi:hypothetical protein